MWITKNHLQSHSDGIRIEPGATHMIIRDNMIRAKQAINDESGDEAVKIIKDNLEG